MGWFDNSKFAFCRGLANHAWKYPPRLEYHGRQLVATLECVNCESERHDRINASTGVVDGRRYEYPEGYLLELDGKPRPEKSTLRRDAVQLLMKGVKVRHLKAVPTRRKVHAA